MRQDTLAAPVPDQSDLGASVRPAVPSLPAELLSYAAAQLLPVWLLTPGRVRGLDLPQRNRRVRTDEVSDFMSAVLVSVRPATGVAA